MNIIKRIISFYYQGFRNMTWGKTVWVVILIKIFVFFFIMKMFFFPNILQKNFSTDEERSAHVLENLTNTK